MAQATLNGIAIDYTVGGRGRPVILSHGYGATGRIGTASTGRSAATGSSRGTCAVTARRRARTIRLGTRPS